MKCPLWSKRIGVLVVCCFLPYHLFAADVDIVHTSFQKAPVVGHVNRVYAVVRNNTAYDLVAYVHLSIVQNGAKVLFGTPQIVTIFAHGETDGIFTDGVMRVAGDHLLDVVVRDTAELHNVDAVGADVLARVSQTFFVDSDNDGDGYGDRSDPDDDNDGVPDDAEKSQGTDSLNHDTDRDGVGDRDDMFPLDPTETTDNDGDGYGDRSDPDDDNDGVPDESEVAYGTHPKVADTDGDGISDYDEQHASQTNPLVSDTDGDGVSDFDDAFPHDADYAQDRDDDEIPDEIEENSVGESEDVQGGQAFVIGDDDRMKDPDNDGLTNKEEWAQRTNMRRADTDGDGMTDGEEVQWGTDPLDFEDVGVKPHIIIFTKSAHGNWWYGVCAAGMSIAMIWFILWRRRRKAHDDVHTNDYRR